MSYRKHIACSSMILLFFATAFSKNASAQFPCNGSYGGGYGYQSQSYYGQPSLLPFQGGYQGAGYIAPNSYAQLPALGVSQGYLPSVPVPTQSYYSSSVNYVNPYHSHHSWHPGHYLLGHH